MTAIFDPRDCAAQGHSPADHLDPAQVAAQPAWHGVPRPTIDPANFTPAEAAAADFTVAPLDERAARVAEIGRLARALIERGDLDGTDCGDEDCSLHADGELMCPDGWWLNERFELRNGTPPWQDTPWRPRVPETLFGRLVCREASWKWWLRGKRHAIREHLGAHGVCARDYRHRRITFYRRSRGAPVSWEFYTNNAGATPFRRLEFGVSNPDRHAWWAITVSVALARGLRHASPLDRLAAWLTGWIPATGHRMWRDPWSPLRPWAGPGATWPTPRRFAGNCLHAVKLLPTVRRAVPWYVWPLLALAAAVKCLPVDFGADETLFILAAVIIVWRRPGLLRALYREASAGRPEPCACDRHVTPGRSGRRAAIRSLAIIFAMVIVPTVAAVTLTSHPGPRCQREYVTGPGTARWSRVCE
jgi:hypothetical protein